MGGRDCDYIDLAARVQEHEGELKPAFDNTPGLVLVFRPGFGRRGRRSLGRVNGPVVTLCKTRADGRVVLDLVQELGSSLRVIPDGSHRRIKR